MAARVIFVVALLAVLAPGARAQAQPDQGELPGQNSAPPNAREEGAGPKIEAPAEAASADQEDIPPSAPSTERPGESSSRRTIIDLSPPPGDVQQHPDSEVESASTGVNELRPWNPHRAAKDVEVGDYYFGEKNYRGAEARYRDALVYKPNDAVATYRLAQVLEKKGELQQARLHYESYLKILPNGPYAKNAQKALQRLPNQAQGAEANKPPAPK